MTKPIEVQTIGGFEGPVEGFVVFGATNEQSARRAIDKHQGAPTAFPEGAVFLSTNCRTECWACGGLHVEPNANCDGDEESHIWNFRVGRKAIVVMLDGRSVFDHYPPFQPPEWATQDQHVS